MSRSRYNRSSRFFTPFVGWFYLGYTIKATKSETLYLRYKYKKKGIKHLFFSYFPRFPKQSHLFLDIDKCKYDFHYCEANSYFSNTVGSYICTSDRNYRLEQQ